MQQQKKPKKEFSILKWIVFPATCTGLALIIANFNYTVFGQREAMPYIIVVGLITFFSICICKYATSENRGLAIGAFACEIFLFAALLVNATWSLSVQRSMSIAKQNQINPRDLRGLDREAQRNLSRRPSAVQLFNKYESTLFWIFAGEMALFGICYFSLWGVAQIVERKDKPQVQQYVNDEIRQPSFAERQEAELATRNYERGRRHSLPASPPGQSDTLDDRWKSKATPPDRQLTNGRDQSKKFDSH